MSVNKISTLQYLQLFLFCIFRFLDIGDIEENNFLDTGDNKNIFYFFNFFNNF